MAQLLDELDAAERRPGLLQMLLPLLPKLAFYGTLTLALGFVIAQNISISSRLQRAPVMVELANGKTTKAVEVDSDYRSKESIKAFVMEIMPLLFYMSNKLPTEIGGGTDKGIAVEGMQQPVTAPIYAASWALTEDGRLPILKAIAAQFPPNIWSGQQKVLRIYHLDDPVQKEGRITIAMTASFYTVSASGQPIDAETFNREIRLIPVEAPRRILKPTPLDLLLTSTLERRLMISEILPKKGE